jgi:hypothetical protein
MIEWVLIIWVTVGGNINAQVSAPMEVGTYRIEQDCWNAAEAAVTDRIGDKRGAVTAMCVPRDK